jgi:tRNA dimethylallyltransferase
LALKLARRDGGVIVNADSMQVYSGLGILTARPGPSELAVAPHRLYGHVDPCDAYSTGRWLRDVGTLAGTGLFGERRAIFVGGTGLYFRALLGGLSPMPPVPEELSRRWRHELAAKGARALHGILSERDPVAAAVLEPADGQRIVRALEVLEASGRSILDWRRATNAPLVDPGSVRHILVVPDRETLVARIERRLDRMLEEGAAEDVEKLLARKLDPALPAMKAIGVREIGAALAGEITMAEATRRAKAATRQYAKRQATWFRHQLGEQWERITLP